MDSYFSYSLTIASPLVSMALAVDMTLLTFTIVALAIGALKKVDSFDLNHKGESFESRDMF